MGGHAAGGTIRRGLWCDGVQISAVGDGGAGVHLAYHRTELTLICYCELSCHIGTLELCISVQFAYKAAAFLIDNLIRLRLFYRESTGKIAVLDNTVCISGNASQRCGCTICTIIVSILDDSPTNATTNHTVAGIPSSNAADCRCTIISPAGERDTTTDHAVPYRSCTGIGNTSQKRRSTDNRAIHTQIFNYAALCKFPHKAGCNESTNGVIIAVQGAGELIATGADGRPGLAVEVDVGGEFGADISLPVLDGIGKPGQLRGGIDQVDTALVLRGRGLGRAVPSLTGIGQCYRDGVVFGSGKAAADRDIVRLGDGIGIRLAGVDDVCAVLVCCDRAAHGVGHGHRGVRRSYGKGQGTGGKFAQRDGLVHIGANGDVPRLGLVAELADGVGVVGILGSDIDILAFFAVRRLLVNGGVSLFQCYRRIIGGKLQGNDRQLDKGNGNGVVPLLGGKLLRYLFVAFLFHRIGVFFANCQGITSVCTRCQAGVALFQRHSGINCRSCRILDIKAHGGQHLGAEIAQPNAILPLVPAAIFSVVYGDLIPGIYSDGKLFPILLFTTVSAAG